MDRSTATANHPKVLILGAGLGGLTLAQALRQQGVPFEIFERDESDHGRSQGWAIALHTILTDLVDSVPDDMPPIDVTSHLLPLDLPAQMCLYRGDRRFSIESQPDAKIVRANRSRLRDWLATGIDVQWNKRPVEIVEDEMSVKLIFPDGTHASGDVLVGADGTRSFVRKHLLKGMEPLENVPSSVIIGETKLNREQYERQLKLAHSAYAVIGETIHTFVGLNSVSEDQSSAMYYWFLIWNNPQAGQESYWTTSASKKELYDFVMDQSKHIRSDLTEIFRLTKADGILTPQLVLKDMVLESLPAGRITLLGDAAHPMTPFRGEGGCTALQDALNLARTIAKSDRNNVKALLKEYQDEMLPRGATAVKRSRAALDEHGRGPSQAWGGTLKESNQKIG